MFCVRISVTCTGKQTTVPQVSSMCFTYCLGSFFTCHVFSAVRLQKLYYWTHFYVPQPSISIHIMCASSPDCNTHAFVHICCCAEFFCIVWWEHMQRSYTNWPFSEFLMLCGKRICCVLLTWIMQKFVEQTYAASVPPIVLAYKLRVSRIVMYTMVCIISTIFWLHSISWT